MRPMYQLAEDAHPGFRRAIEVFGTPSQIAGLLGISRQAVGKWRETGVPPESALRLELLEPSRVRAVDLVDRARMGQHAE